VGDVAEACTAGVRPPAHPPSDLRAGGQRPDLLARARRPPLAATGARRLGAGWRCESLQERGIPSTTSGSPSVDLRDLVRAILLFDALAARQWLADAARTGLVWSKVPAPLGLDATEAALAAGVVELLASRSGQPPPGWAAALPAAPKTPYLVRAAASMPRLRAACARRPRAVAPSWPASAAGFPDQRLAYQARPPGFAGEAVEV
jgi:hypothetical protein